MLQAEAARDADGVPECLGEARYGDAAGELADVRPAGAQIRDLAGRPPAVRQGRIGAWPDFRLVQEPDELVAAVADFEESRRENTGGPRVARVPAITVSQPPLQDFEVSCAAGIRQLAES